MNLEQLLHKHQQTFAPILGFALTKENSCRIDLSKANKKLQQSAEKYSDYLEWYIQSYLVDTQKQIAWGGYQERRFLYNTHQNFSKDTREIHLGIDIWTYSGQAIYAPLSGHIHSFADNAQAGDYGPCIILEHTIEQRQFFSLYGHLSRASLENLSLGQKISKGEHFANLGSKTENGLWPPHLHFQVIQNMGNYRGDYPGVANQRQFEAEQYNCIDPAILLNLT